MTLGRGVARALAVACALCLPATAEAADRIYVANEQGSGRPLVSFANLDGSGGGDLVPGALPNDYADGVAIDAAAGRLYFGRSSSAGDRISFVNLDGTGRGDLSTPGVTVDFPNGLAIDPAAGMIYWANYGANQITFARLDGSGAGTINTVGATVTSPIGVAIDPAGGRIYWANNPPGSKISFANLDGSGGGDLNTAGATSGSAWGVALDVAAGRIYWGNGSTISFARLDSSGGGDLPVTGATVMNPGGAALDIPAGRIYWANTTADTISFAALDGSGGANLATSGASLGGPSLPALLKRPAGAGAPVLAGGSTPGSELSCSRGSWAPDLLGAFLYRAPASFTFEWSREGVALPGATASALTATEPGDYRCTVTASNFAGSSSQTSAVHTIAPRALPPAFGALTRVHLALAAKRIPARGPIRVSVRNQNPFEIDGTLTARTAKRVSAPRRRVVNLKGQAFSIGAGARMTVKLTLPRPLRHVLQRKRKVSLLLRATVTDPAGNIRTVDRKVRPELKRKPGAEAAR
ncbi:MAG: hypothetical protein WA862_07105 [Solirubrobacterales bacterium]